MMTQPQLQENERDPRCPFCQEPALVADPRVPPSHKACVDPECQGAHGWVYEDGIPIPWELRDDR